MELNKAFQKYLRLFNYKTYVIGRGYYTANFIYVWEQYERLGTFSQGDHLDMWSDILNKWIISISRKIKRTHGFRNFNISQQYQFLFNSYVRSQEYNNSIFSIYLRYAEYIDQHNSFPPNPFCYNLLKSLYNNYTSFIHMLNEYTRLI